MNQPSHPLSIWRLKTEFVLHLVRKCLLSITYFRGYLLSHNSNRTGNIFCRQKSVFFLNFSKSVMPVLLGQFLNKNLTDLLDSASILKGKMLGKAKKFVKSHFKKLIC